MGEVLLFLAQLVGVLFLGAVAFVLLFGLLVIALACAKGFADSVAKGEDDETKKA